MKEMKGDLLAVEEGVIAHQVNCVGAMGAGVAKQIRQKLLTNTQFEHYKQLCKTWGGHALGTCYLYKVGDRRYVANLFGENVPTLKRIDTNYGALQNACNNLRLTAEQHNLPIAVPGYIGCGLAGGNWEYVYSDILVPTFKDYPHGFSIIYDMRAIKNLWSDFGNISLDPETERIEQKWHGFKPGTHREEIWRWFEKTFEISVAKDLMHV